MNYKLKLCNVFYEVRCCGPILDDDRVAVEPWGRTAPFERYIAHVGDLWPIYTLYAMKDRQGHYNCAEFQYLVFVRTQDNIWEVKDVEYAVVHALDPQAVLQIVNTPV